MTLAIFLEKWVLVLIETA